MTFRIITGLKIPNMEIKIIKFRANIKIINELISIN